VAEPYDISLNVNTEQSSKKACIYKKGAYKMTTGGAELSWGGAMTRCSCEGRQALVPVNRISNRTGFVRRTSPERKVQVTMICSSSCQRVRPIRKREDCYANAQGMIRCSMAKGYKYPSGASWWLEPRRKMERSTYMIVTVAHVVLGVIF